MRSGEASTTSFAVPPLHVVTDDALLADPAFAARARRVVEAGGAQLALHVRGPCSSGRVLFEAVEAIRTAAAAAGARVIVNDRVDVALAAGVRWVQLGSRSLPVGDAKGILGEEGRVGASTHTPEEAAEASGAGASWLVVGTLYATPSHGGLPGRGAAALVEAAAAAPGFPLVGIGGITPPRVAEVLAWGARGVAVIRGVWGAPDPEGAVRDYLQALSDGTEARRGS